MATAHSPLLKSICKRSGSCWTQYPYRQLLHSFHRCSRTNPDEGDLRGNRKLSQHQCLRYLYMGRNRRLAWLHSSPAHPQQWPPAFQPNNYPRWIGHFHSQHRRFIPNLPVATAAVGQNFDQRGGWRPIQRRNHQHPDHHGCYV